MNTEHTEVIYQYIKELNEEAGLVDNTKLSEMFTKLIGLEKSFESKLRKTAKGRKVYSAFIDMIYKANRGMIALRPYFRQREDLFLNTINKAIEHNKPDQLYGSPINYRFAAFAMNTLQSPSKELVVIFENLKAAREDIIKHNLFLALGQAKIRGRSTYSSTIELSDLIQIANEALMISVDKFVPDQKSVFAHMAIGRIIAQLIADGSSPSAATVTTAGKKKLYKIRKLLAELPDVTRKEISEILNIAESEVNELMESTHYSSLDQTLYTDDTQTLGDIIEDPSDDAYDDAESKDLFLKLLKAYECLSIIELKILRLKGVNPMKTLNKLVAVSIPQKEEVATKNIKGFEMLEHLDHTFLASTVIFDSQSFKSGDKVYFRADSINQHALRQKYNFAGKEFVLLSEDMVAAIE